MYRKFLGGLVFGAGFAISYGVVGWLTSFLWLQLSDTAVVEPPAATIGASAPPAPETPAPGPEPEFSDLSVDQKISMAKVIALARYEPGPDGKQKAVIREFLKKDTDADLYYKVGDDIPWARRSADEQKYGDGMLIFYTGKPLTMRYAATFSGDRISSLSDIPLALFREKCAAN